MTALTMGIVQDNAAREMDHVPRLARNEQISDSGSTAPIGSKSYDDGTAGVTYRHYPANQKDEYIMLREAKSLYGATLHATDGEIGSVDEILFDDEHWTARYLVVNTGTWLFGRKVLISPMACGQPVWEQHALNVSLTREQIKNSPSVETDNPVSRQWETNYSDYYDYPYYWGGMGMSGGMGGMGMWGGYWYPGALMLHSDGSTERRKQRPAEQAQDHNDAHLRSTTEVTGYAVHASDGELGHIEDFIIDDESWAIRYLAIDTRNWWPGKHILLPPNWIERISWLDHSAVVHLDRRQIQSSPEWYPDVPISRIYEEALHSYYGKQGYWDREQPLETAYAEARK